MLSNDVPTNPGPNSYENGYLSFCTWNINSLAKDNFNRINMLEAHNSIFNYDMIFLCETSLNHQLDVPDKLLDGYKFHVSNHPSGNRRGGVGVLYKETLPLIIRDDLSFNESIVVELHFGKKTLFFTVIYRSPSYKDGSPEFEKNLYEL